MEINPQPTSYNLGGKGYQLHRLKSLCTVPPFFVIKFDNPDEINCPAVQAGIFSHFNKQNFGLVSVRSSATVEDGATSSFAGMFESALNVNREMLIEAIKRVVNSVRSDRVHGYCAVKGIDYNAVGMRVVVQQMVQSDVSGVAFTKIQSSDKNITIEAVQGLGEALVSGHVNPDNYSVDRTTLEICNKNTCHQNTQAYITDENIKELSKMCLKIEKALGFIAADVEWTFANGKLYILQARAVTGITDTAADEPSAINPKDYKLSWVAQGFNMLRTDIGSAGVDHLQGLSIVHNGEFIWYIPNTRVDWAKKAGLEKFSDARAFDDYVTEYKEFYANKFPELKQLANNPTRENVKTFFDNACKICRYYEQTVGAYTAGATLELLQDKNSELVQTLEKVGEFRNFAREQLYNQVIFYEDSLLITLLENLSKRFGISTTDLNKYKYSELPDLFDGKKVSVDELAARDNVVFYYNTPTAKDITYITGVSAKQIIDAFARHRTAQIATADTDGIHGVVGCTANMTEIEGTAYLLEIDFADTAATNAAIEKMPNGHILVTTFTSPENFTACKKSSAMVTDLGGILSHTAIVSRELNIPAITGTKNATKLIKTGDRIKLDLTTGEVVLISDGLKQKAAVDPKDYKLFWTVPGFDVLRAEILMASTDHLQTLVTVHNGEFHWYLDNTRVAWAEKAGLEKFSDARAFDDYVIEYKEFYANKFPELNELANNPTRKNVKTFFDNACKILWYYTQTSTAYTNGATLELLQDKNSVLTRTLEKAGEFKNFTRQWFNQLVVYEDRSLIPLLDNLSKKFGISTADLAKYKYSELPGLFDGKRVSADEIAARDSVVFYYNTPTANDVTYITGTPAKQIIDAFAKHSATTAATAGAGDGVHGIVGCTANMTEIEGTAYLLEIDYADLAATNAQIEKMPDGYILVSTFTSPEIFTACKKSSAMVTDLGGILSHTAVVSRELNIPAITGTKNATKFIKTGDRIKLDLTTGEVILISGELTQKAA